MTDLAGAAGWWQNEITGNYMHSDKPKRRPIRNKNAEPYVLEMNHVLLEPNVTTTWILMVEWGQRGVWSPPGGVNLGNKIVIQRETGSSLFLWVMLASPSWCQSKKKKKRRSLFTSLKVSSAFHNQQHCQENHPAEAATVGRFRKLHLLQTLPLSSKLWQWSTHQWGQGETKRALKDKSA